MLIPVNNVLRNDIWSPCKTLAVELIQIIRVRRLLAHHNLSTADRLDAETGLWERI
jgi:hypothetical protein